MAVSPGGGPARHKNASPKRWLWPNWTLPAIFAHRRSVMKNKPLVMGLFAALASAVLASPAQAQIGRTWPSEKKIVPDPVTGLPLEFLTSTDGGYTQSKIYQTHRQWTVDGK